MSQVKKKQINKKIKAFIKSQSMISLILTCLVLFLILFNSKMLHNEKIYVVEGKDKNVMLRTGSITMNNRIIFFNSPNIKYTGDDITLTNYKIGYYVNNKKIYEIVNEDNDAKFSIASVLENYTFNFMDFRRGSNIYTKSVINNIEKLKFVFTGTDKNGKKVNIVIPMQVSEI